MVTANPAGLLFGFGTRISESRSTADRTPEEQLDRLQFVRQGLLMPLTTVTSRRVLSVILESIRGELYGNLQEQFRLMAEVEPELVEKLGRGELDRQRLAARPLPEHVRGTLGQSHAELLQGALQSLDSFADLVLVALAGASQQDPQSLRRLETLNHLDARAVYDAMAIESALRLANDGIATEWSEKSLRMLVESLDARVSDLEDTFLGLDTDGSERDTDFLTEDDLRAAVSV